MNTEWTIERLKNEQPFIECDNLQQRAEVIDKLESMGFILDKEINDNELFLNIYCTMECFTCDNGFNGEEFPIIHYSDFIK